MGGIGAGRTVDQCRSRNGHELVGKCGDDAKAYCENVGYGDAMTQCLLGHKAKLHADCKVIVERVAKGEPVALF